MKVKLGIKSILTNAFPVVLLVVLFTSPNSSIAITFAINPVLAKVPSGLKASTEGF